jgi:hypothetical protein
LDGAYKRTEVVSLAATDLREEEARRLLDVAARMT